MLCDNFDMTPTPTLSRLICAQRDADDPLRSMRERFALPSGVIYLDGNSLGATPVTTAARLNKTVSQEWGNSLIGAWQQHHWAQLPQIVGKKMAGLLGANSDEVIVADSTSINLFKLLAGALSLPQIRDDPQRTLILCDKENFPTDLYIAASIGSLLGGRFRTKLVDADALADAFDDTTAVALMSHVDYRSGRLYDMPRYNAAARRARTRIVWDLSHSAGALPISLNAAGTELAVGCGYKYLNGGPGAPAYAYVARALQADFVSPLPGWFGHDKPFDFAPDYVAAQGIRRLLCGTPSVIASHALEEGLNTFAGVAMQTIRDKSLALTDVFCQLMDSHCGEFGFSCVTPKEHDARGSQLSFTHTNASAIMQTLIARGVIGDFRGPNLLRFGFTPLYTRFVDAWDAVMVLREVMQTSAWSAYQQPHSAA